MIPYSWPAPKRRMSRRTRPSTRPTKAAIRNSGRGEAQHQQPHEEYHRRVGSRDQVALHPHVCQADVVAEILGRAMADGTGLRRRISYPVQQTALHEQPVVALLDQPVRGAPRLLHQHAARDIHGELIQLTMQNALRVAPALLEPDLAPVYLSGGLPIVRSSLPSGRMESPTDS